MQKIVYTAKLKVGQSSFTWIGQKNQINSGYNRLNLVNLLKLPPNTPIWFILKGFLREESWRKILWHGTTFRWVYMQKFLSVWLTVEKELKIEDNPLNGPQPFLCGLYLALGSS